MIIIVDCVECFQYLPVKSEYLTVKMSLAGYSRQLELLSDYSVPKIVVCILIDNDQGIYPLPCGRSLPQTPCLPPLSPYTLNFLFMSHPSLALSHPSSFPSSSSFYPPPSPYHSILYTHSPFHSRWSGGPGNLSVNFWLSTALLTSFRAFWLCNNGVNLAFLLEGIDF